METTAVRLYGKDDLRLEKFELPAIGEDEILAEVVTDSLCMSTYKAVIQGEKHKKVPEDIGRNPIITGHEFCGVILEVGDKWKGQFAAGDKFVIQPNIGTENGYAPGYSYRYVGGDATKIILMNQIMENGSLLKYSGDTFFEGSLVEPLSCVVGAFNAQYHHRKMYGYDHVMGVKEGGTMALLGATGPMGFLAIDLAVHGPKKPKTLFVTGRTQSKLDLAKKLYPVEEAAREGVSLHYINTAGMEDYGSALKASTEDGRGFDDVFVFAPSGEMVTEGGKMLAFDGCLNFFAGPADTEFTASMNFYNVHYNSTHIVGTSGGNTEDMKEAISYIEQKTVNAAGIVTHVLGLDAAAETTKALPGIGGGKKIVYTHYSFPLTAVDKSASIEENKAMHGLKEILASTHGLWSREAEEYFLSHAPKLQ